MQHVVGRDPHDEGWRDLQAAVREVISEDPDRSYIAFIDDRQLAERAAAGIEAARSITEDAIIVESRDAMAYRSGLMRRERIEEALREGDIRGLASTSAMEMGIDIPDLQVGFNLGLPHSVGKLRQRAGRVGRTGPGRFVIVAPRHALQFHEDSLDVYWNQSVEPARLYPSNPNIKNTHGRCLAKETDLNGMERAIPSPTDAWPEQLPQTLREIARGDHYAPEFQTGDPQQPHRNDIRDAADGRARIVQLMPGGEMELLTSEVTRREAARDAYPLATYLHAKQSYSVLAWRETGGETVITARHAPPRETRPITQSGATVTLQQPRMSNLGHLEYCTHAQAVAWERIVGCSIRETGDGDWRDVHYGSEGIPEVVTNLRTTATVIIVWEDWFDDAGTRRDVARALRTVACSRESIHPADIRTTHQNVQVVRDGRSSEVPRAIVLWDRVGGGLGLSKAIADNLGRYTQALLEIARSSGQRSERERLLREDMAAKLHRWAVAVAPHTLSPEQTPRHHRVRRHNLPQPAGGPVGGLLRPAGHCVGVRAGAVRGLDARLPAAHGRRPGLRRGQAGERVSHGRGPADAGRRLWWATCSSLARVHATPGVTGTADGDPRTSLPDRGLVGAGRFFRGPVQQHLDGERPVLFGLQGQELSDRRLRVIDTVPGLIGREGRRRILLGQHPLVMGREKDVDETPHRLGLAGEVGLHQLECGVAALGRVTAAPFRRAALRFGWIYQQVRVAAGQGVVHGVVGAADGHTKPGLAEMVGRLGCGHLPRQFYDALPFHGWTSLVWID